MPPYHLPPHSPPIFPSSPMFDGKLPPLAAARSRHASTYSSTHLLYLASWVRRYACVASVVASRLSGWSPRIFEDVLNRAARRGFSSPSQSTGVTGLVTGPLLPLNRLLMIWSLGS